MNIGEIPAELSLFKAKKFALSHPLILCQTLQYLHHLCNISVDLLHYTHFCLVVGSPELDPERQM